MRKSNTGSKRASLDKIIRYDERPRHRSKRHATSHCEVVFAGPPRPEQNTARPKQTIGTCATYVRKRQIFLNAPPWLSLQRRPSESGPEQALRHREKQPTTQAKPRA